MDWDRDRVWDCLKCIRVYTRRVCVRHRKGTKFFDGWNQEVTWIRLVWSQCHVGNLLLRVLLRHFEDFHLNSGKLVLSDPRTYGHDTISLFGILDSPYRRIGSSSIEVLPITSVSSLARSGRFRDRTSSPKGRTQISTSIKKNFRLNLTF